MIETDSQLIAALREGRESAFKEIFERHYSTLCAIANNYLGDSLLAEDIVSEVIMNLWLLREKLDIRTSLRVYLSTAIRNRCINFIGSSRNRYEQSLNEIGESSLNANTNEHPLGHLLEQELEEKVKTAIRSIPIDSKRVFMLSRYHQMSYMEIAENLGISVNTVKYHIKQSLAHLRKELKEYL